MLQYTLTTGLTAGAVLFTSVAAAADDTLTPVVVTASRTAETADQTLAPVSVITRAEIERRQPRDLLELLRTQPGIDLARNGGPGQQASLFLRGTNSDHTLVLIDGVRASSITTGGFAWQHLAPAQIERIEIVRGPRASLYGSDAIGGVIQIFTRKSEGPTLRVGAGSDRTFQGEAGYGASHGPHHFSLHASAENSDGFSATNSNSFSHDPDDDGYRNRSLNARWQADFSDALALSAAFWHTEGDIEFDTGTMDSINQNLSLTLDGQINDRWSQSLQLGYARDDLDTDSASASQVDGNRLTAGWQHDILIGMSHLLSVGLDYYRDQGENINEVTSTTVFDETITNRAAYASLQTGLGENDLQFSLRHDEHSRAGGETTGQAAWGRALGHGLRAVASYGTAFKAPTLNQLFHPGFFGGSFAGNPNLEPERSRSAELGLRYHSSERPARRAALNLFHTRVDDLIAFQGANSQAINIDEATIRGLELEYADAFGAWSLDASLTLQRARNDETDDPLLRRPDEKLSLAVSRDIAGRGGINAEVLLVGEREDVGTRLPGYGLVNLAGYHQLNRDLKLQARIENLLDKDYQLASGFNTPDRKLMVTLEYAPR